MVGVVMERINEEKEVFKIVSKSKRKVSMLFAVTCYWRSYTSSKSKKRVRMFVIDWLGPRWVEDRHQVSGMRVCLINNTLSFET